MAALKELFGTDAEMRHPRSKEESDAKFAEVNAKLDNLEASQARLDRLVPARNIDEAMKQMVGDL